MRLKKTFPEKSSFASTLLVKISLKNSSLSSACTLLRFPASTLLRFYAFGKFSPKKSTFACKHLRFYASEQFSKQISPFASELLCFYASRTISPKKSSIASELLCFSFSTLRLTFPTFPCMNMDILIFLPINLKRCLYEGNL